MGRAVKHALPGRTCELGTPPRWTISLTPAAQRGLRMRPIGTQTKHQRMAASTLKRAWRRTEERRPSRRKVRLEIMCPHPIISNLPPQGPQHAQGLSPRYTSFAQFASRPTCLPLQSLPWVVVRLPRLRTPTRITPPLRTISTRGRVRDLRNRIPCAHPHLGRRALTRLAMAMEPRKKA